MAWLVLLHAFEITLNALVFDIGYKRQMWCMCCTLIAGSVHDSSSVHTCVAVASSARYLWATAAPYGDTLGIAQTCRLAPASKAQPRHSACLVCAVNACNDWAYCIKCDFPQPTMVYDTWCTGHVWWGCHSSAAGAMHNCRSALLSQYRRHMRAVVSPYRDRVDAVKTRQLSLV
jgi:hypothetical protein